LAGFKARRFFSKSIASALTDSAPDLT